MYSYTAATHACGGRSRHRRACRHCASRRYPHRYVFAMNVVIRRKLGFSCCASCEEMEICKFVESVNRLGSRDVPGSRSFGNTKEEAQRTCGFCSLIAIESCRHISEICSKEGLIHCDDITNTTAGPGLKCRYSLSSIIVVVEI